MTKPDPALAPVPGSACLGGSWKVWLAFRIGSFHGSPHSHTSGRDALRSIRAYFDQMGAPLSEWPAIEAAALQNQTAIGISADRARRRVMEYIAEGPHPIGPIERLHG